MNSRKNEVLAEIIRNYIREASPVGSKALEENFDLSSATIRNEMSELESEGYLYQPYTSAGRVPTVKAYQYYVKNLISEKPPASDEQHAMEGLVKQQKDEVKMLKYLARQLAEFSHLATVVGFGPRDVYYTGLSDLFSQPEFIQVDMVRAIAQMVDHLDEAMVRLYHQGIPVNVEVKLGDTNPFGEDCALVVTSYSAENSARIIGLLGPVRMDYDANIARLRYVKKLLA